MLRHRLHNHKLFDGLELMRDAEVVEIRRSFQIRRPDYKLASLEQYDTVNVSVRSRPGSLS